jgi:carboxyl-terminal processing protease
MEAYLNELDEYCRFIPPSEHKGWKEDTKGEYAGLGVKVLEVEDGLVVSGLLKGGPADLAGVLVDDTIVAAEGRSLAADAVGDTDVRKLLKGPPESTVRLRIAAGPRPKKGPATGPVREVTATRKIVRSPTVFSRSLGKDGQFAVIRIREFKDTTSDDFDKVLQAKLKAGAKAIVLDLRENGGGVLPAAVHVADRFLARGVIVRMEGRAEGTNSERAAKVDAQDVPDTVPVAVLVNGNSASASEVVAGALQDHRRALLVGERSYGKFLVQQITDIPGRDAAVQLTTSRYYTPSGRSYQRKTGERTHRGGPPVGEGLEPAGLLPDVPVALDDAQRKTLRQAFENEEGAPWGQKVEFPDVPADHVDPQLQRAMEILEGELVHRKIRRSGR